MAVGVVKPFKAPKKSIGDLDAEVAATLIAAAADIALIVDANGVIRDVAFGNEDISIEGSENWLGQAWVQTVTVESRPKVEALLRDSESMAAAKWRQVNHPSARGADIPILYSAVRVGQEGRLVAVGRDLRSMAALQQRLVDAQQSIEREYSRLRHVETRYRLLFQMGSEAVLIADASTLKVVDANPAAGLLLEEAPRRLVGRAFADEFEGDSAAALGTLLDRVRWVGRGDDVRAHLKNSTREVTVSASLFRQDASPLFLIRLVPVPKADAPSAGLQIRSRLLDLVERSPDGFVVTDLDGRILTANPAFLELVQLQTEEQVRGESLERWLGRPGVDLNVLTTNLRQHGSIRLFATTIRDEYGSATGAEISAVAVMNGEQPCLGFTIRAVDRRLTSETRSARNYPRPVEELAELVGRVSLKDLVRETTDVIERLCIEAALEITGDNRASAAEMLGLSRQSLYVKLRRYGLGDLDPDSEE